MWMRLVKTTCGFALVGVLALAAQATQYAGDYFHYDEDDGLVTLTLQQQDGQLVGQFVLDGYPAKVVAQQQGDELRGEVREGDGEVYPFRAQQFAGKLNLVFDDGDFVSLQPGKPSAELQAQAARDGDGADDTDWNTNRMSPPLMPNWGDPSDGTFQGSVNVNGQTLTPQQVQQLAQYGVQIQPGNYWYDPVVASIAACIIVIGTQQHS